MRNFFAQQEKAKTQTSLLLFYFALAIVGISVAVYAVLRLGFGISGDLGPEQSLAGAGDSASSWFDGSLFAASSLSTLALVILASGFKSLQLLDGGRVVARELGGHRLDRQSSRPEERRLLNVVDEMAIASGLPVPEVYVLEDEDTINAFAAGRTPSDAAIGVTRGCLRLLNRDELQGVIAHEFSHILNGDMRLNMRLMALIFGITVLTLVGRIAFRLGAHSREKGAMPFVLLGLALIVIGFLGSLFGRLIQRAVSRQREFLADAAAVQFTRNPGGIGGALKKIGGLGSHIDHPHAADTGHLMIAAALSDDSGSLFDTHPPLSKRILAIDPQWDGVYPAAKPARPVPPLKSPGADPTDSPGGLAGPIPGTPRVGAVAVAAALSLEALEQAGKLHAANLERSRAMIQEFPPDWREAAQDPSRAPAIIFGLLLDQETDDQHRNLLAQEVDEGLYQESVRLREAFRSLPSTHKIALIDLAIPSIRRLSREEYRAFREITEKLVWRDKKMDLFEFTLQKIVERHLDLYFREKPLPKVRYRRLRALREETTVLLSALANVCGEAGDQRRAAFQEGAGDFVSELGGQAITYRETVSLKEIDQALERFAAASALAKRQLLFAAARTVAHDDKTTDHEAELIRAIADAIGMPVPPLT